MAQLKKQVGCCFLIDGEEYIYEGSFKEDISGTECSCCQKRITSNVHVFNSLYGYDEDNYESRFYGSDCVRKIIQTGYRR